MPEKSEISELQHFQLAVNEIGWRADNFEQQCDITNSIDSP